MTGSGGARNRGPSFASENEDSNPSFNRIPSTNEIDPNVDNNILKTSTNSLSSKDHPKSPQLLVKYKEETFNIHGFLDEHPGGRSILEKYENKDITRAFDDINHSQYARKKMQTYLITDQSITIEAVTLKSANKIDSKFVIKKLFTKDDEYLIHKTLGFLSLWSYCYRYLWVYPTTGNLGFTGTTFDWCTIFLHFLLSSSSLIFHVVERRIVSNPLIIYQEYRLHAIVFTCRGLLVTVFGLYQHLFPSVLMSRIALAVMICVIHLVVDYITKIYGTPGITTVRNDDNGTIPYVKLFFAFYQVLAMSSHLIIDPKLNDLGWNTVIAIQSSAFLMTLKRKSLIRALTHFYWYSFALILSMIYITHAKGPLFVLAVFGVFLIKVKTNMNKYIMWTAFVLGYYALDAYLNKNVLGSSANLLQEL